MRRGGARLHRPLRGPPPRSERASVARHALRSRPHSEARTAELVLTIGASNFLLRGRGPFGRLVVLELLLALGLFVTTGFLTSLPPASSA